MTEHHFKIQWQSCWLHDQKHQKLSLRMKKTSFFTARMSAPGPVQSAIKWVKRNPTTNDKRPEPEADYCHLPRILIIKKVKCTLVQALRLCTDRTAHRGSTGIALLFLDHVTGRGRGVSVTSEPHFTPEKDPVPIVQETGWAPGPVWTGAENLTPTGIRSPDRPSRSQSLYRLSYRSTRY